MEAPLMEGHHLLVVVFVENRQAKVNEEPKNLAEDRHI